VTWPSNLVLEGAYFALDGEVCAEPQNWPAPTGSESITRVGRYFDDAGLQWWIVRVTFPVTTGDGFEPTKIRVVTIEVNSKGGARIVQKKDLGAGPAPSGQATKQIVQLTAVEPYPL